MAGFGEKLLKNFKRIAEPFSCNAQVMQLAYAVWIVDAFLPVIQFFEAHFGDNARILPGRSRWIQSLERPGFCHTTHLQEYRLQPVLPKHPYPDCEGSVPTPVVSPAGSLSGVK